MRAAEERGVPDGTDDTEAVVLPAPCLVVLVGPSGAG